MGKKKFIDKKKSATFHLLARDSSDPNISDSPGADRVFVRVDNNSVSASFIATNEDPDSIFGDAPGDDEEDHGDSQDYGMRRIGGEVAPLPEDVRKEILELGFPDDGYNYLMHLREIKNAGGGSFYYENPKFKAENIPHDVKAYDASRLQISEVEGEAEENIMYSVASKTTTVRVQKAVDPEVAALLDDSDLSRFGSDVEDLEEDFVLQANLNENDDDNEEKTHITGEPVINRKQNNAQALQLSAHGIGTAVDYVDEKPMRARRLLDEQFDLLERKEYGTDDDGDDDGYGDYYENCRAEEDEYLAEKLKLSLNNHVLDDIEPDDGKYKVPADLLKNKETPMCEEEEACAADVILRCKEYAEGYEVEDEDRDVVLVQESSDESEVWDCETIVSTYSTLDNHPGKIGAPEGNRKKKLAEIAVRSSSQLITLGGKEKLPVDFLPGSRKPPSGKVKGLSNASTEQYKRKQHGQESKEEKKERKAAVKEERREARRIKKEMKGLYRCEAQRAQRTAAVSGPSTIHLM